jgi:hydrogenase/urease accessory protein HupE
MMPLHHLWQVVLFMGVGALAARHRGRAMLLLPAIFLLMLLLGIVLDTDATHDPLVKLSILLVIICAGALAHAMSLSRFVAYMLLSASTAFWIGGYYASILPAVASPAHFMLGAMLCSGFLLAGGICMSMSIMELFLPLLSPYLENPRFVEWKSNMLQRPWVQRVSVFMSFL